MAENHISVGQRVLKIEAQAISELSNILDYNFEKACEKILNCQNRLILTGMGKSGHIAKKMAATFASTGTPAFFLHPAEASHGDLGMVTPTDLILACSHSGETEELSTVIPLIRKIGCSIIAITANPESSLSKLSDLTISTCIQQPEACSLGLAPTTSTTVLLALGDALAISVLTARGFTTQDFARAHPGGQLGRQHYLTVQDLMHRDAHIPIVTPETSLNQTILEMTEKKLGFTLVLENRDVSKLIGLFTDGDLRRTFKTLTQETWTDRTRFETIAISNFMTTQFKTIRADQLASTALTLMKTHRINALPVLDPSTGRVSGVLNMHDLLKAKII